MEYIFDLTFEIAGLLEVTSKLGNIIFESLLSRSKVRSWLEKILLRNLLSG